MNKGRKATIAQIVKELNEFEGSVGSDETNNKLEEFVSRIESVREDEQSSFDNLPEVFQSNRQDSHDEIMGHFDDALAALEIDSHSCDPEDIESGLNDAAEALEAIE